MFGRDDELRRLRRFLDDAVVGGAALVLVGDPGVGKTTLLDAAAAIAADSGCRVLRGGGVEFEADVSFSTLHQLLSRRRAEIGRLGADPRQVLSVALGLHTGPQPSVGAVTGALVGLLRLMATEGPVVLIVDDLHWVDTPSAVVLAGAAPRVPAGAAIIGALRADTPVAFDRRSLPQERLAPLPPAAAAALLELRFPLLAPRMRQRVLTEAQGNPLALLEFPVAIAGSPDPVEDLPSDPPPLTDRLYAVFGARVAALPAETRDLLLQGALGGGSAFAAAAAADLAAANEAGLITVDGRSGRWGFRHPLVRATVVAASTMTERRRAHHRIAGQLDDDRDRQVWHLSHASTEVDEQVAQALERSAERSVGRGDAPGAVELLVRAAGLTPATEDRARRLAAAAYLSVHVMGEIARGAELLAESDRADRNAPRSLPAAVAAAAVELHAHGNVDTAHELLATAIDAHAASAAVDDPCLIEAMHILFEVCLYGGRPELWPPFDAHAGRIPSPAAAELTLRTDLLIDPVRTALKSLPRLEVAITDLEHEPDPARIERVAASALFVDRLARCRGPLQRVLETGRAGRAVTPAIKALFLLAQDAFHAGRWVRAQDYVDEGLGLCDRHGFQLLTWPLQLTNGQLAAARGDERSGTIVDAMTAWASPLRIGVVTMGAHRLSALAALGRGDFEDAYQHTTAITPAGVLRAQTAAALWVSLDLVEAAVRTGRHADAAAHIGAMRAAGIARLSPRLALLVDGAAGMVADGASYREFFDSALRQPGVDRWPFDAGRVRLAYGERLRRAHATLAAREQLDAARTIFVDLGAEPWTRRATDELHATGVNRAAGSGGAAGSLTPQEHQVARLATSGLTNKQIAERLLISPRTVGAHLRQVFLKLGISSRAAIGDAVPPADG